MSPRRAVVKVTLRSLEHVLGLDNVGAKILSVVASDPLMYKPGEFHLVVECEKFREVPEGSPYPQVSLSVHKDQLGEPFAVFQ